MIKTNSAIRTIVLCLLGIYLVISTLLNFAQIGSPEHYDLNDTVIAHVVDSNGKTGTYRNMFFPNLSKGSEITFDVSIPEKSPFNDRVALCFYQYHSEIEVYFDNELIYSYGKDLTQKHKMYGNEYIILPIMNRYWGETLNIKVKQMEGRYSNHYTDFRLMRIQDARLYPMIGSGLEFLLFGTTLVLSICMFVMFVVLRICGKKISKSIAAISMFCFLLSVWQLSSRRLFYVFVNDISVCSLSEYFSIYLIPIPLFGYMGYYQVSTICKRVYFAMSGAFAIIFLYCIMMHEVYHYHLVEFEVLIYIMFLVSLFVSIYIEMFHMKRAVNGENIMRNGILISMGLVILQFALMFMQNVTIPGKMFFFLYEINFSSIAILIYMGSLIFTAGNAAIEIIRKNAMEAQTRKLAYVDVMTGIPNRFYCEEYMDKLSADENYSIVFMDADHLKYANDTYGHKMGDRLLLLIAEAMKQNFESKGCYARWGGDEFIAVLHSHQDAEEFVEAMQETLQINNEQKTLPFRISVSYGIADHDTTIRQTPDQVRDMADERMYKNKLKNHRER